MFHEAVLHACNAASWVNAASNHVGAGRRCIGGGLSPKDSGLKDHLGPVTRVKKKKRKCRLTDVYHVGRLNNGVFTPLTNATCGGGDRMQQGLVGEGRIEPRETRKALRRR